MTAMDMSNASTEGRFAIPPLTNRSFNHDEMLRKR
jgi:hypothetical protein